MFDAGLFTGEQVRAARAIARIDQSVLAERCGVSLETIKRIERIHGVAEVNSRTHVAIVQAFANMGIALEAYEDGQFGVRTTRAQDGQGSRRVLEPTLSRPSPEKGLPVQVANDVGAGNALGDSADPGMRSSRPSPAVPTVNMMGYWDRTLKCRFASPGYLAWFGRRPSEMIGIDMRELLGMDLFEQNHGFIQAAIAGEQQVFERSLKKPDGNVGHTVARYIPDIDAEGRVLGFRAIVIDSTAVKLAELALANAQAKFESTTRQLVSKADEAMERLTSLIPRL